MKFDFNENVAKEIGVEEAIMLSNIEWWVKKNEANNRHFYEGYYWSYNSQEAFQKLFKFWSRRQVQRILKKLADKKYLKSANFNKKGYDKTLWYTSTRPEFIKKIEETLKTFIAPNGAIDSTVWVNGEHQTVLPIPDNKPDNKHNIDIDSEDFEKSDKSAHPVKTRLDELPNLEISKDIIQERAEKLRDFLGDSEKAMGWLFKLAAKIPESILWEEARQSKTENARNAGRVFSSRIGPRIEQYIGSQKLKSIYSREELAKRMKFG